MSLSGRYLRSRLLPLALIGLVSLALSGCSSPLSSLATGLIGKGPNVAAAADIQVGKTNTQTIGSSTNIEADRVEQVKGTKADKIENVTVNEVPIWYIVLLILGWLLPSPNEIGRWLASLFKRKQ